VVGVTQLEVDLPEAPWVAVPLDGDPSTWARATAEELCDGREDPAGLTSELELAAGSARTQEALACAVVVPEELPLGILALLVVHQVHDVPDLDSASALLAAQARDDVREPVLSTTELPLGPAARWHTLTAGEDGFVMEAVDHVVPLGDGTALRSELSWTAVVQGDDLIELADRTAAGLRVVED
jgi:hypothetical protein